MTASGGQAWYVYSVLPEAAATPASAALGLLGSRVEAVACGSLTVLASLVPRALFDRADPANRAADPDWMAACVTAHHAVNAAAAEVGPCLPLAFGALFSGLDRLRDWLSPRAAEVVAALRRVDGHAEWALSLREDAAAHTAWLDRHDPALERLACSRAGAGAGTAYLMTKQLDRARAAARAVHLAAVAGRVTTVLAATGFVVDAPAGAATMADNATWSLLAPRVTAADLQRHAVELAAELTPMGLSPRLTGPWPAYAFARAALAGETAHV